MLTGSQITEAGLIDWRKMGQGLHARYVVEEFGAASRFVAAVAAAGDSLGHHPAITITDRAVDLVLVSDDAVFLDGDGTKHVVTWVTEKDVMLARQISDIAAQQELVADPGSLTTVELALDTANPEAVAPMWAALLTGSTDARGFGTMGNNIRDPAGRVPNLWFQDTDAHETPQQRFHLDVWVAPEAAAQRIAAAIAAGGTVVDDTHAPAFTVLADADGNRACVCTSSRPAQDA